MTADIQTESTKVQIVITSVSMQPDAISSFLGVKPTKTWLHGQKVHPKATNTHKKNGWVLQVHAEQPEPLVARIVDRLIATIPKERLSDLHTQYQRQLSIELSVIVYATPENIPSVALDPEQVKFLADCGASFDLDLYVQ